MVEVATILFVFFVSFVAKICLQRAPQNPCEAVARSRALAARVARAKTTWRMFPFLPGPSARW